MSIYLVALTQPNDDAWSRLKDAWPNDHYILTNRLALVGPGRKVLTEDVCTKVGIDDHGKVAGFVAEIDYNAINGWTRQAFWEWLRKNA